MTGYQRLYSGIGRAAWGYFFVYFDFKLNTVSLTPAFIGYLLFLSAIALLCNEERELKLIRALGILLALLNFIAWVASWYAVDLGNIPHILNIIVGIINLYFHFQFITNLASIAAKYQTPFSDFDKKLLRYRTLQTIMLTSILVLSYLLTQLQLFGTLVSLGMAIVYLIAAILIMRTLFAFRRCLPEYSDYYLDTETE